MTQRDWRALGTDLRLPAKGAASLPIGTIFAHDHRALEVVDIHQRDNGKTAILVRRIHGPKHPNENRRQEFGLIPSGRFLWRVYDRRVPLCSCCGFPWPCPASIDEDDARQAMRHAADMIARAHPGFCQACGEPITSRQASISAPEPHLLLPGFDAPQFHLRRACRDGLDSYDRARRERLGANWAPLIQDAATLDLAERTEP